jgi:hypothetical protein
MLFLLARQELYHLSLAPQPFFCFSYFSGKASDLSASHVAGVTGTCLFVERGP